MTTQPLAIDKASPFVRDVAALLSAAVGIDSNQDGNISLQEGLNLGQLLLMSAVRNFSTINEALAQLRDVDADERKELVQVFVEGFDLSNDEVEQKIETTLIEIEKVFTSVKTIGEVWGVFGQKDDPAA